MVRYALFAAILGLIESATYFEYDNHDGVQVGSKYFFFPSAKGESPDRDSFFKSRDKCENKGGTLATPMNEEEDNALRLFLTEHYRSVILNQKWYILSFL